MAGFVYISLRNDNLQFPRNSVFSFQLRSHTDLSYTRNQLIYLRTVYKQCLDSSILSELKDAGLLKYRRKRAGLAMKKQLLQEMHCRIPVIISSRHLNRRLLNIQFTPPRKREI